MNNSQIAKVFESIAGLLEMKDEPGYTVRAYQRAARTIERLPAELDQMVREGQDLREIPGIGKAISDKITEMVNTDGLSYFERLRSEFPEGILDLLHVPGLGPKTTMRAWKDLGVRSVDDLEQAIVDCRLEELPRMGKKAADNILRHIRSAHPRDNRMPIASALPIAERMMAALRARCPGVTRLVAAGSIRRFEETIGDIDLVCAAGEPREVLDALVGMRNVADVLGHGDTKASVLLTDGIQLDLRVVEDRHFGALLQYSTGSKEHAVLLRDYANRKGLSLNEYGVTDISTGEVESFASEEALYERLGLQYVPPELRVGTWELEAAIEGSIPPLVEADQLKADLHVHTDWSDGRDPLEMVLAAAKERGLEYVAITDHSVGRGIANGLSPERLRQQIAHIRDVARHDSGLTVLCGTEMDIRADGSVDFSDDVLSELDWVIGSVHSAMTQDSATMTQRIITAMRNPHVSVIGHLTTRLIGERQPIEADFEAIFRAAADTGTALEINASPKRLDLKDAHAQRARELGVPLVISTDAHTVEDLGNARFGVAVARRAWCQPHHILNTLPLSGFMDYVKTPKSARTGVLSRT